MTAGFGEVLRERGMERVRDEVGAFFGAYGEAATGAFHEGNFDALERSTEEFVAALKEAIPSWVEGKTVAKEASERTSATAESPTGTGQKGRTAVTDTFTKGDVRGTADVLAKERHPELAAKNPAAARAKVYEEVPDLVRLHESAEPEAIAAPEAPVFKAADPFAKLDAAAREGLPELYRKSPSMARTEISKARPDLAAEYHGAHGAR